MIITDELPYRPFASFKLLCLARLSWVLQVVSFARQTAGQCAAINYYYGINKRGTGRDSP